MISAPSGIERIMAIQPASGMSRANQQSPSVKIINGNLKRKPIRTGFSLFLDSLMKLLIVMPSMIRAQTAMAAIIAIGTFGSGSPAYTVKPMMPKIRSASSAMVHMAKKVYCNAFINTTYH